MLLHRSIHRPFPTPDLPNNSTHFNSDNPLTPSESPIIDSGSQTIMPALLVNRPSTLSDHSHDAVQRLPSQAYIGPECSYAWPKLEPSRNCGHTSFGCRVELSSSAIHSETHFGHVEDQAKGEDRWGMEPHQQLPTPFSSLSPHFNSSSFETDHEPTSSAKINSAIRSPILPTPSSHDQMPPWTGFATGDALEEAMTRLRCNPPQAFTHDTAPSFGASLYATSSDVRTSTQPKMHRSFRRMGRLDPMDSGSESEGKQGEPPYAKLIYRALMDAPDHQMVLKDIYEWIARNTDKARDPAFKGWQNSVRHNLSMNGAFTKVPHVDPSNKAKKGFIWVLEPSAIDVGIESTTRYRQKTVSKRSLNFDRADPKRQRSGRKGGRATRKSAKLRKSALLQHDARYHPPYPNSELSMNLNALPDESLRQVSSHQNWNGTIGLPYYLTPPLSSIQPSFPENGIYDYGAGNPGTQPDALSFDRHDQTLFSHPFDSRCDSMQHEGSSTRTDKFEGRCLANGLPSLS